MIFKKIHLVIFKYRLSFSFLKLSNLKTNDMSTPLKRIVFPTHKDKDLCNSCFSLSVMCLMNWGKYEHNNPGKKKIYSRAPVIPLMTSLMKVASLQNNGHSLCLNRAERGWLEETSPTHFLTGSSSLQRLAFWLCGGTCQDWCVFLTMAIYIVRCCLAMWEGGKSLSRAISSHSVALSFHFTSTNHILDKLLGFKL